MSRVVMLSDGRLGRELGELATGAGHTVRNTVGTADVDLIVEAVIAQPQSKRQAVAGIQADAPLLCAVHNASATGMSRLALHPENVVGWAALPPLAEAQVIEVYPGLNSSSGAVAAAREFFVSLGKEPVEVGDTVGGVLPRVVASLVNEAAYALMEGVAAAEDIDAAMQQGTNYPHGPLAWGDLIGLDQVVGILNALAEAHGPDIYRPAPLLRQLVHAGRWGQRTGRGFYTYDA